MKVAVTSQNFKTVTNHAGKCRKFIVFDVSEDGNFKEVDRLSLPQEMAFSNFRGGSHPLDGVDALLSLSFGAGFVEKTKRRNIIVSLAKTNHIEDAVKDFIENGQNLPDFDTQDHEETENHTCGCGH